MKVFAPPTMSEMVRAFGRIGLMSFGGPAAQIAVMHRELVEERPWLSEKQFLGTLSFCMLLPGPEAMQLATYAGWRLRGMLGGLLAGLLFVVPGAVVIALLAVLYAHWGDVPMVQAAFDGIKALVILIVFQALRKVATKALTGWAGWAIATLAFVAIFALNLPFPLIILIAGLAGAWMRYGQAEGTPRPPKQSGPKDRVSLRDSFKTAVFWAMLWAAPVAMLWLLDAEFLTQVALFFSKLAIVTFGGAYAVLAYMAQAVVDHHNWLTAAQMIDALGLAETTPGPLILVTQFVAQIAGFDQGGLGLSLMAGIIALWVTFVPCFLWVFTFAPHVERLLGLPQLAGALAAITAAVVGVIANLSLWFALHVFFAQVDHSGTWPRPVLASLDLTAVGLTIFAALIFWGARRCILTSLALCAAAGIVMAQI